MFSLMLKNFYVVLGIHVQNILLKDKRDVSLIVYDQMFLITFGTYGSQSMYPILSVANRAKRFTSCWK